MVFKSSLPNADSPPVLGGTPIHRLPFTVSHRRFSQILNERKLLVSPSGRHVARLQSRQRGRRLLEVVHQNRLSGLPVKNGFLLCVMPNQLLIWGQGTGNGVFGVYLMQDDGAVFLDRLDCLKQIIQTPSGTMLFGRNEDDDPAFSRYVLPNGRGFILAQKRAGVTLHSDGRISLIEPKPRGLCHELWHSDGSLEEVRYFPAGAQVQLAPWQNGFAYVQNQGHSFIFETEGVDWCDFAQKRELPGQVERLWCSPSQKHIFFLVCRPERGRLGCAYRQLYLDGELVEDADGHFRMGQNDLRWSPDDSQFVARLRFSRLLDQGEVIERDRLITSLGEVYDAPEGQTITEMAVDNLGQIMFFVLDDGQHHFPHYYGVPLPPATFIWNIHNFKKRLSGNQLKGTAIEQFRLPRRA